MSPTQIDTPEASDSSVGRRSVAILGRSLSFVFGGLLGLLLAGAVLLVMFIALSGRDEGPAPFIDPGAPAQAGGPQGDGEVRVVEDDSQRLLQRCRGACDEIIQ